uniref:Tudor domain-containing protein n=1 Tax=Tetraselmis sp. GSL018 TaxID=582737 RepID=A0A061RTP4_9CHLO|mmetsp:Transcript_41875/g.99340  ORF Transcript_41875/g.99340 Transcript_41875/m.99340 type:complete len:772 (+) Transcript_41875:186-2501(+)
MSATERGSQGHRAKEAPNPLKASAGWRRLRARQAAGCSQGKAEALTQLRGDLSDDPSPGNSLRDRRASLPGSARRVVLAGSDEEGHEPGCGAGGRLRRSARLKRRRSSSPGEPVAGAEAHGSEGDDQDGGSAASGSVGSQDRGGGVDGAVPDWICAGAEVMGRWSENGELYPGKVLDVQPGGTVRVLFDDGEEQDTPAVDVCRPALTSCSSREDEITGKPLRPKHVCWASPDNSVRMCFNLSTLRKVAVSVGQGSEWKQPPHFRTPMDRGLRKQIACRFGPSALSLELESLGSAEFEQSFRQWAQAKMGKSDLRVCPICYAWLLEDMEGPMDDPISVLTSSPGGEPAAAQLAFCSKRALVAHLEERHDIKAVGRQHSGLLERHMIRQSDGLLQSWLHRVNHLHHRAMRDYWLDSNAQVFLCVYDFSKRIELGFPTDIPDPFPEERYVNDSRRTWEELNGGGSDSQSEGSAGFVAPDEGEDSEGGGARPPLCLEGEEGDDDPWQGYLEMVRKKNRGDTGGSRRSSVKGSGSGGSSSREERGADSGSERTGDGSPHDRDCRGDETGEGTGDDDEEEEEEEEEVVYDTEPDALDLARSGGRRAGAEQRCKGSSLERPHFQRRRRGVIESDASSDEAGGKPQIHGVASQGNIGAATASDGRGGSSRSEDCKHTSPPRQRRRIALETGSGSDEALPMCVSRRHQDGSRHHAGDSSDDGSEGGSHGPRRSRRIKRVFGAAARRRRRLQMLRCGRDAGVDLVATPAISEDSSLGDPSP